MNNRRCGVDQVIVAAVFSPFPLIVEGGDQRGRFFHGIEDEGEVLRLHAAGAPYVCQLEADVWKSREILVSRGERVLHTVEVTTDPRGQLG
jgi:hypothetical protein